MSAATGRVDDFVKEYLTFRGLSTTLRTFEAELKNEKEKGFRVDKMVEQLHSYITTYDLANLREYWNFLNARLFARLEQRYMNSVRKLEVGLLKMYLVNAHQNGKQDKIIDFFERMTDVLQTQSEFKEWFAFPFVRVPEDNSHFSTFFTRQWQDMFLLSLHNFLSVILHSMQPVLLNFEADYRKLRELQEENLKLKMQVYKLGEKPDVEGQAPDREEEIRLMAHSHMETVYDFSSLGEDTAIPEPIKSPRKFPFPSSPLSIVKRSEKTSVPVKKKDDQMKLTNITPKDPKSKSSGTKLLPVITRQRKTKPVQITQSQSHDHGGSANHNSPADSVASLKTADLSSSVQKVKRHEQAKQERKELLEGNSEQSSKDDKAQSASKSNAAFNRSVSEPNVEGLPTQTKDFHRTASVRVASVQPQMHSSSPKSTADSSCPPAHLPLETVPHSMSSAPGSSMLGTMDELQSFPPINSPDPVDETSAVPAGQDLLYKLEKPFLLLSQDEYCEHRSAMSYARFSPSGQYIASVDLDGVVKVWTWTPEASTAATVMSRSAFLSLEWASKSDRWLLLGNRSGNIRLFDVREMKSFYEATGDVNFPRVVSLCSSPASPVFVCSATTGRTRSSSVASDSGHATRGLAGKLTLWDLKTMTSDRQLPLDPGPVCINSCAFNHNGQLLVSAGDDGKVRLFDVSQQRCISQWEAHRAGVRTVMFSADYTSCYSLGNDGELKEWSMQKTGNKLRDLPIHLGAVPDLSADGTVHKEEPLGNLLALDLDGGYLLTCSESNSIIYKMLKEGPGMMHLMDLKGPRSSTITTVDWSPNIDTKVCLTGHDDGKIIVSTLLSQ